MKNTLKKLLSVILAVLLVFGVQSIALADSVDEEAAAESEEQRDLNIPVVDIPGINSIIYSDKDDIDSKTYRTTSVPADDALDIIGSLSGKLLTGIVTGHWDDFSDALYEKLTPYFAPLALDSTGRVKNITGYDCLKEEEVTDKSVDGKYGLYDYTFIYDWRLDPYANAVELDAYINDVKNATGVQKVDIRVSGVGLSTLLAYFEKYGFDSINECVLKEVGINGVDEVEALFTGNLTVDKNALNNYLQENLENDDLLLDLVQYAADFLIENGFTDSFFDLAAKIYSIIYENVVPKILWDSYATMPGLWSLVGDGCYAEAKEFMLSANSDGGDYTKKYSILIEKIDRFHNEIQVNTQTILDTAKNSGVNIYNLVGYGRQILPMCENADVTSDTVVSISSSSPGIIAAKSGEKFSDEYMTEANESGTVLFISPDCEIDASEAYLKSHTWYIKNYVHGVKCAPLDELAVNIFNWDGYLNVFNSKDMPQYFVCNDKVTRMEPLTETGVIAPTFAESVEAFFDFTSPTGFLKNLFMFISKIVNFFRDIIDIFIKL